jgi:hypothetical protein
MIVGHNEVVALLLKAGVNRNAVSYQILKPRHFDWTSMTMSLEDFEDKSSYNQDQGRRETMQTLSKARSQPAPTLA